MSIKEYKKATGQTAMKTNFDREAAKCMLGETNLTTWQSQNITLLELLCSMHIETFEVPVGNRNPAADRVGEKSPAGRSWSPRATVVAWAPWLPSLPLSLLLTDQIFEKQHFNSWPETLLPTPLVSHFGSNTLLARHWLM